MGSWKQQEIKLRFSDAWLCIKRLFRCLSGDLLAQDSRDTEIAIIKELHCVELSTLQSLLDVAEAKICLYTAQIGVMRKGPAAPRTPPTGGGWAQQRDALKLYDRNLLLSRKE